MMTNWERAEGEKRAFRCTECGHVEEMATGRPNQPHDCEKYVNPEWIVTYTTAPSDYDWFGTVTVAVAGTNKRDQEVRKVASHPSYVEGQRDRYMSGLHMAVDEQEWQKLVSYGLATAV